MRKVKAKTHGSHCRRWVCGKFSLLLGTQASFYSRSCDNTRSQSSVKKARSKSEINRQAKKDGKTVHFAIMMDLCHLKNAELAKHLRKYKGRVVLQEDTVKDEEGHRAVFTEQGASASQLAAAKFLDPISQRPGMVGEASDAVSAHTQVKMTEAPRLLRIPQEACPDIWNTISPRQRPKGWDKIEDPVVPLERHVNGHPLASLL